MNSNTQNTKFSLLNSFRESLSMAGIATKHTDSLICPLCWQETRFNELSIEHIVPGAVGGSSTVLTCRKCNNEHGSQLDAHLVQYQKIADAFQGHGMIPSELYINGKRLVANLEWREQRKNFVVVGNATDPRIHAQIQAEFQSGAVDEINFTLSYGYAKQQLDTAILRAAYLITFWRFGYPYVTNEIVQILRRRICDRSLDYPRLGSLIVELQTNNYPLDKQYLMSPGTVNGVPFILVILRIKRATISHFGVFMPFATVEPDVFFSLMDRCAKEHNGEKFKISVGE